MRRYGLKRSYYWSGPLAYVVGLIASDGCLSKDGRHICFTSKDYDSAVTYRDIIRPTAKIGITSAGNGLTAFRVQLGDVAFYDFLLNIGLTPAKSHTIRKVAVPDAFYPDFFRGVFDGDGSTYGYWDKRWKSSFMYYAPNLPKLDRKYSKLSEFIAQGKLI